MYLRLILSNGYIFIQILFNLILTDSDVNTAYCVAVKNASLELKQTAAYERYKYGVAVRIFCNGIQTMLPVSII
jgi:hypothetical protein